MTVLVYAVAAAAPPEVPSTPPPPAFWGLSVTWRGADGSVWDLSDWSSGVALLSDGVSGLHWPQFDLTALQADMVDGHVVTGVRAMPRPVEFRVGIWADNADDWAALNARWWRSWHPLATGELTISSRRGSRTIRLRLQPGEQHSFGRDPHISGYAAYQVEAVADTPLWAGDQVVRPWSTIDVRSFLDPDGSPPFWVTPRSLVDSAVMPNPGDVAAWPVWMVTATGGTVNLTITCNGGTIGLPAVTSGQTVRIDTSPISGGCDRGVLDEDTGQLMGAVDIDPLVTPWQPRRVPPGDGVPIGLSMTGPGKVTCQLTPLHYRGLP